MHKKFEGSAIVVHIEADHANALLMQCLLSLKTNYTVHHAADGNSGLELCRRVKPDLVITESHLPDMTAYDILQALRSEVATACLPCIVLSGDAMPLNITRALSFGFHDYWTKPIDVWQVLQKIDKAIAGAQ